MLTSAPNPDSKQGCSYQRRDLCYHWPLCPSRPTTQQSPHLHQWTLHPLPCLQATGMQEWKDMYTLHWHTSYIGVHTGTGTYYTLNIRTSRYTRTSLTCVYTTGSGKGNYLRPVIWFTRFCIIHLQKTPRPWPMNNSWTNTWPSKHSD